MKYEVRSKKEEVRRKKEEERRKKKLTAKASPIDSFEDRLRTRRNAGKTFKCSGRDLNVQRL